MLKLVNSSICHRTFVTHKWIITRSEVNWGKLVSSTGLIVWIGHRKETRKLTFRAVALVGANHSTNLPCNTGIDAAPLFLKKLTPIFICNEYGLLKRLRSRWFYIGQVFSSVFHDRDLVNTGLLTWDRNIFLLRDSSALLPAPLANHRAGFGATFPALSEVATE